MCVPAKCGITCCMDDVPMLISLVLRAFTEVYRCVKFILSLDLLCTYCLIFKGVHEIAALSWSFCFKTKGQEIN
jgi:hypothetical protein